MKSQGFPCVVISELPRSCQRSVRLYGADIQITHQRTGYGQRRYFLCPRCGRKCGKLYLLLGEFYCRSCSPVDLYRARRSLYDEAGTALITYHMLKISENTGLPIRFPFHYCQCPIDPPPGMSHRRYHDTMMQLQALENMRFAALAYGATFTAADIRRNTDKKLLHQFELYHLSDYQVFGTGVPVAIYAFLLDGSPPKPPTRCAPLQLDIPPEWIARICTTQELAGP